MKGFDLVCKSCGDRSDLGNVYMVMDYILVDVTVSCPSCDSYKTYGIEEDYERFNL